MGRFASTVPYYSRYREPYPGVFFEEVAARIPLTGKERLLDAGCGPGLLAIGFAPFVASCTGVDPEPGMLDAARQAAAEAGVRIAFIQSRIEDLPPAAGTFDFVTFGRSIHWMDRTATLAVLERVVNPRGAIAICGAPPSDSPANPWLADYKRIRRAWSPDHDERRYKIDLHLWFADSRFRKAGEIRVAYRREITIDDLIGRALSYSTSSPDVLGPRLTEFESELRAALAPFATDGALQEEISAIATLFSDKPVQSESPGGA